MKATLWMTGVVMAIALASPGAHAATPAPTDDPGTVSASPSDEQPQQVAVLEGTAVEQVTATDEEEEEKSSFPLGATIIYENSVGIGTFVPDEYQRRSQWSMLLSIRPRVKLTDIMSLVARLDISKDIIDNYDAATTVPNQTLLSDVTLTWNVNPIVQEPVTGLKLNGWIDLLAPTSLASQYETRLLTARAGLGITKEFGWVNLYYMFRFDKYFHERDHRTLGIGEVECGPLGGKALDSGACSLGGYANTSFQFMNRFIVEFVPVERLGITIDFLVYNAFTYDVNPDDALTAENAVPGRGQRDLMAGTFEVSYQVLDQLTLALGTSTLQPPKTLDNEGFRFPFFDFSTASNNFTSIYFDVIGTF